MTNPRFVPSASLLLAFAACAPEFALIIPETLESLTAMVTPWGSESESGVEPPVADDDTSADSLDD